jgi:outer membrane usher protein FimD/PapC
LRRLKREDEAAKTVAAIKDDLEVIENGDYYKLIGVYKGTRRAADLFKEINQPADNLSNATVGYGLGNWFLYNGQQEVATKTFQQITAGNQWASFGYIAAESELKRVSPNRRP